MGVRPFFTVVVCTRGRPEALRRCLASLERLEYEDFEVLVVDNHEVPTVDGEIVGERPVRLVHESRRGLNVARNRGVREAKGDVVAFVDDDCEVDPKWLEELRAVFAGGRVTFVTGRVRAASLDRAAQRWFEEVMSFDRGPVEQTFMAGGGGGLLPRDAARLGTGCNMAFSRSLFDRIGPFDEALDMGTLVGGGGDIDYFGRALDGGEVAVYWPRAVVRHHHRQTVPELRRQLFGYGASVGALSLKFVQTYEGRRLRVLRNLLSWVRWTWALARARFQGYASFPLSLLAVQLVGLLWGPVAYLLSRRGGRRSR